MRRLILSIAAATGTINRETYTLWQEMWAVGSAACCDILGEDLKKDWAIDGRTIQFNQDGFQYTSWGVTKAATSSGVFQASIFGNDEFVTQIKIYPWYGTSSNHGWLYDTNGQNGVASWADYLSDAVVTLNDNTGAVTTTCTQLSGDISIADPFVYNCFGRADMVQITSSSTTIAFREVMAESGSHISTTGERGIIDRLVQTTGVAANTRDSIFSHGCWCSKLGISTGGDTWSQGGLHVIDDVDNLCKDWIQARRCHKLEFGACYDGTGSLTSSEYTYQTYKSPSDAEYQCAETSTHGSGSQCQFKLCMLDTQFMNEIIALTGGIGPGAYAWVESGSSGQCALGSAVISCDACCQMINNPLTTDYDAKCYNRAAHGACCNQGGIVPDDRECINLGHPSV